MLDANSNSKSLRPVGDGVEAEGDAGRREVLISRLVDSCGSDADWSALRSMAAADATVWSELASAQRDAALLARAAGPALLAAERTELPAEEGPGAFPRLAGLLRWSERAGEGRGGTDVDGAGWAQRAMNARSARLGWAVAALVALAWTASVFAPRTPGMGPTTTAGLGAVVPSTYDAAIQSYLDLGRRSGRVVGELPDRVVLDSRPLPDGSGFEVTYLRQFVERATVERAYRVGETDTGGAVLIPAPARPAGATPPGEGL